MVIPWILISIGILIILLGVVMIISFKIKGKQHKPDYASFFSIGVVWTIFGVVFFKEMFFFLPMGIIFMILGLINRDKWKKHQPWKKLNQSEKILKIIGIIILVIGILALGVYYFLRGRIY